MQDPIRLIPLTEIDDDALPRDRSGLDPAPLEELRLSIAASGLRMPVEVMPQDGAEHPWGLLSGYRRIHAFRALFALTGKDRYAAIPAFVRPAAALPEALAAMVEENEIRAPISPWEQGRVAVLAHRREVFGTIEEAVNALFPAADRNKRARLRGFARLFDALDGYLTAPERLNARQCLRIETALRAGFAPVIQTALSESSLDDPGNQWRILQPILTEAEAIPTDYTAPDPGRPRRVLKPRTGLTIRREQTRDGWSLHFTGEEAVTDFMDVVFNEVERIFLPEEEPREPSKHL